MRLVLSPSPNFVWSMVLPFKWKNAMQQLFFQTCWALFVLVSLKPLETQRFQPSEWPWAPKPARVSKANLKQTASSKIETNSNLAKLWLDSRWNSVTWGKDRKGQHRDGIVMIWAAYTSLVHLRWVLRCSAPEAVDPNSPIRCSWSKMIQNDPKRHK